MEYYTGGDLFDVLNMGRLDERCAKKITKQLLEAVGYCHEQGIAHLDIKPENIMLSNKWNREAPFPDIKLIDFGLASTFETMTECSKLKDCETKGTPEYLAPEVAQHEYNGKADIWSIGCVLYAILNGGTPFHFRNGIRGYDVSAKRVRNLKFYDVSDSAQEFIKYLLTYDYRARPDTVAALKHSWLQQSNVASDVRIVRI